MLPILESDAGIHRWPCISYRPKEEDDALIEATVNGTNRGVGVGMLDWRNLIADLQTAGCPAGPQPGLPSEESLRRAVSTAYYAMFHALSDQQRG